MRSAWIRRLPLAALLLLLGVSFPGRVHADGCHPRNGLSPCIDADNLWPHTGGGSFFAIGSPTTTPAGKIAFGLVGSFLTQPVGVRIASADPAGSVVFLVDKAFDATLLFALGVTDRFELTLAAPATLYQSGSGLAGVVGTAAPPLRSATGDMRFGFAFALLRRPRSGDRRGPALTGRLEFASPTGAEDSFARGPTAVVAPSLAFSFRVGRVDLAAEALGRLRGEATFGDAVIGTQVGGALGASVDILRDRWLTAGAEAFALYTVAKQLPDPRNPVVVSPGTGALPPGPPPPLVPAEWIAHVSTAHFLGGDVGVSFGGGGTLPFTSRPALTSPRYRLDFAIRYAPTGAPEPTPRSL